MHGRKDSHRDNSAHLWVVEFFLSLCSLSRRIHYTFITVKTQKSKQTNRTNFNSKNSIEIAIFQFTDMIRFRIMGQLTAFFSLSDEPRFCLCIV